MCEVLIGLEKSCAAKALLEPSVGMRKLSARTPPYKRHQCRLRHLESLWARSDVRETRRSVGGQIARLAVIARNRHLSGTCPAAVRRRARQWRVRLAFLGDSAESLLHMQLEHLRIVQSHGRSRQLQHQAT